MLTIDGEIDMKQLLFIYNPRAGKLKARHALPSIQKLYESRGYAVCLQPTAGRGDAMTIAKTCGEHYDHIVCCGGDGTLNEVVNGMQSACPEKTLGYIPAGTTNDFATTLRLPRNLMKAAQTAVDGTPTKLDIGKFNDRYFTYVAACGAFSESSYSAPQSTKNAIGYLAYILQGLKELPTLHPVHLAVEADGIRREGEYIFGAVSNSTSLGGLVKLDQIGVSLSDGLLEVTLVKQPKSAADFSAIVNAATRQDFRGDQISVMSAREIVISSQDPIPWSLDGEYAPPEPAIRILNCHHALTLLL